jgi:UDP-glucuronate 4-epimerase
MALFKFTKNILENKPIDVYNRGKMSRNFTYIDDIVSGVITVLDTDLEYEIINIGGDREEKLTRYIEVLEECLEKKSKKKMMPLQPGDVLSTRADIRKLKKLGWKPKTTIEIGVKNFVDWYEDYFKIKV